MPGVNKKPTSKSFNAVTPLRRSARRLCTSAPRPTGSCYGTKPTRGTLDLHHSKYNDTKLTRKSVTYVVELKCYPCEWRAVRRATPPTAIFWRDFSASTQLASLRSASSLRSERSVYATKSRQKWIDIRGYRMI